MGKGSGDGNGRPAKKPLQVLRERCGGIRPEVKERSRRNRMLQKAIRGALAEGPRTVPELAEATGEPTHEILWMLMAMKKYGEIREGEERGEYYEYALLAEEAGK